MPVLWNKGDDSGADNRMNAAILTCRRPSPTLKLTGQSLRCSGFDSFRIYRDRKKTFGYVRQHVRAIADGNHFVFEDDCLVSNSLPEYVASTAPTDGIAKLYLSSYDARMVQQVGWSVMDRYSPGALGYCWPAEIAERFLNFDDEAKQTGEGSPEHLIDRFCRSERVPLYVHKPSLIVHIGLRSCQGAAIVRHNRQAESWLVDAMDPESEVQLHPRGRWMMADVIRCRKMQAASAVVSIFPVLDAL